MTRSDGSRSDHVPPLGVHWLTPAYDATVRLLVRDATLKRVVLEELDPRPGERLLDLGCGTGTFVTMLKRRVPQARVEGVDLDARALAIARRKVTKAGLDVVLHRASIAEPDGIASLDEASFDGIVSSLVFHHLTRARKKAALRNALRLLRPGGRFILADWGPARGLPERCAFLPVRLLDGFATTADNVAGMLPVLMEEAGFADVRERRSLQTVFGRFTCYRGERPGTRAAPPSEEGRRRNERKRAEEKKREKTERRD